MLKYVKGLSTRKDRLLQQLFQQEGIDIPEETIKHRVESSLLSYAQERLWIIDQLEPGGATYNIPVAVRLKGALDVGVVERVFKEVVKRHEVLRTRIEMREGRGVQVIEGGWSGAVELVDLREKGEEEQGEEIRREGEGEARRGFDLSRGPLLRVRALKLGEEEHVLLVTMHHIVSDGWSMGVLVREVAALYEAFVKGEESPLPELKIQYADYAVWQREWLQGEVLEEQLKYWREQLKDLQALEMPTDHPRPAVASHRGACVPVQISGELLGSLKELSEQEGSTLFMVLLAGFQVVMSRYSGQEDVVVGTDVANRTRAELEELIGFFVNQLVLRVDLSGDPSVRELLGRVREVCLGAYTHQDLPFERLVEDLNPKRDLSREPLFQVKLVLQNAPFGELRMGGMELAGVPQEGVTAKFDLTLSVNENEEGLRGVVEYATDLFERETVERMLRHWERVLEEMVGKPEGRISELKMLREEERQQVVEELNRRSNQLGHYLRGMGVGAEVRVGICVERSLEMVVGLMGILKAGGAYVPLDAEYPLERLAYMVEDAQVPVLLTQERIRERLPETAARIVELDKEWEQIAKESIQDLECVTDGENAAYVIYTSGSTGRPKGVVNTQGGIGNRLLWMQDAYGLTAADRVLQKTSFGFDVSVWEFFWPLMVGACLVMAKPGGSRDSRYVVETIYQEKITTLHFVPSMLDVFLKEQDVGSISTLRQVICSGEALSANLVERFHLQYVARLYNLYGPTEAAVDVTFWECPREKETSTVVIGRPIANTKIYILD